MQQNFCDDLPLEFCGRDFFLIVKTVPSKILFVKNQTLNLNPFKLLLSKDNSSKQCISFFVAGFLYGFFVSIDKFL